jgi:hypothetical protein
MRTVSALFQYPTQSVILNMQIADCPGFVADFVANLSERSPEFAGIYINPLPGETAENHETFADWVSTYLIQSGRVPFVCLRNPGEILLSVPDGVSLLLLFV